MAAIGYGTKLAINTGASQAFVDVPELLEISLPPQEVGTVDVTALTTATPNRIFTPGLVDPGVFTFTCGYQKTTYNTLIGIRGYLQYTTQIPPSGPAVQYKVTMIDEGVGTAQTFTFGGILTKVEVKVDEGYIKIMCEVKVSGAVTIA